MGTFENYAEEARRIELEMARQGVVLGIDWDDELAVRALAREALACRHDPGGHGRPDSAEERAKLALFGLAQLMLTVMTESAGEDLHTHGGPIWKAFGRALWLEADQAG